MCILLPTFCAVKREATFHKRSRPKITFRLLVKIHTYGGSSFIIFIIIQVLWGPSGTFQRLPFDQRHLAANLSHNSNTSGP